MAIKFDVKAQASTCICRRPRGFGGGGQQEPCLSKGLPVTSAGRDRFMCQLDRFYTAGYPPNRVGNGLISLVRSYSISLRLAPPNICPIHFDCGPRPSGMATIAVKATCGNLVLAHQFCSCTQRCGMAPITAMDTITPISQASVMAHRWGYLWFLQYLCVRFGFASKIGLVCLVCGT